MKWFLGAGKRDIESYSLIGSQFKFYKMKRVMLVMVAQNYNIFNTTELYT